jgi:chemotaxis family two-component system response regulator PixG
MKTMNFTENQEAIKLTKQLQMCMQMRYTGKLTIKNYQGKTWSLYYQYGQLVWATGGTHTYRRWQRNINQNCPLLAINQINYDETIMSLDYWDYVLLLQLYRDNLIQSEQVKEIVVNTLKEIFFDLYQKANFTSLTFNKKSEQVLDIEIISISNRILLKQVQTEWNNWVMAGLSHISPHLAPVIIQSENLGQEVSKVVHQNFERLMNGNYTLYDLSVKMNQNILAITGSLMPYISRGIMEVRKVPDISLPWNRSKLNHVSKLTTNSKVPVIACVDDSANFCKLLERVITSHSMKFISIQDPIQALPTLIQNKPDLIFLDLMMPTVNGYELCAQLRCISIFSKTPIVILTASERVFDQARAKVYGATDFINKSVSMNQVLATIQKHISETKNIATPMKVG